ncbi:MULTISPECIES: DUF1775 domain-containing protein [unclassified Kitasatospora]|uniref:DUF1775 domain-containing protein n=1 Tax=unclassified Kitasatospora TaxID=2633591 RepID=UPI002F9074F5
MPAHEPLPPARPGRHRHGGRGRIPRAGRPGLRPRGGRVRDRPGAGDPGHGHLHRRGRVDHRRPRHVPGRPPWGHRPLRRGPGRRPVRLDPRRADGFTVGGTALVPGEDAVYKITIKQLPNTKELVFKTLETYSDGRIDRWIELPKDGAEPEHPAPTPKLAVAAPGATPIGTPSAAPTSATPSASATASAPAIPSEPATASGAPSVTASPSAAATASGGDSSAAVPIAIGAAVVVVLAAGGAWWWRRKRTGAR